MARGLYGADKARGQNPTTPPRPVEFRATSKYNQPRVVQQAAELSFVVHSCCLRPWRQAFGHDILRDVHLISVEICWRGSGWLSEKSAPTSRACETRFRTRLATDVRGGADHLSWS